MRQPLKMPPTKDEYWAFRGGLDQVSPSISLPPGKCRDSSNVEVGTNGGLTTTEGYERFDGQARPSESTYHVLSVSLSGTVLVGDYIIGETSSAAGYVIAIPSATSLVLTPYRIFGQALVGFTSGENLKIGGAVLIGVATGDSMIAAASTLALDATYKNLAADKYRELIAEVPGSGPVLGVWKFDGVTYAFRNNTSGTAAVMYQSTSSGWTAVTMSQEMAFTSGGVTEILPGDTITGSISAATAIVGRVVLTSGTWAAGTAAGFLYVHDQASIFQAENLDVGASLNLATIAGNSSAITLAPNGRYEFRNHNFAGTAGTTRMYGCSGVHKAFEFDGTTFALITTGMALDTPDHIFIHKNHLFLAFGHSVQHSSIGTPLVWSVVLGASELSAGDDVTNFIGAPGSDTSGTLVIVTRNMIKVLYGNSSADWNLVTFNPDAGGLEWTGQYLGQGVVLDDRGVTTMASSQAYGNFKDADISANVRPYVSALRSTAIASCVAREKNQYRIFFNGGAALYCTFIGNKLAGAMPISLSHPVACICSLEANTGEEEIFFGSTNGFVYQMDRGTSHDGETITWHAHLAYNHFGSPRQMKRFRKAVAEISGAGYAEFSVAYSLGYGSSDLPTGDAQEIATSLSSATWDNFAWDSFTWDGQTLSPSEADIDGTAENISLLFSGNSDEFASITFNGAIVSFTPQRQLR